jgi:hypothetical protein
MKSIKIYAMAGAAAVALAFVLSATGAEQAVAEVVSHVIVDNTPAQSIPVRDVSGRDPFTVALTQSWPVGGTYTSIGYTIPTGKRLVVEHVSVRANVPSGQRVRGNLVTPSTPYPGTPSIPFSWQGNFSGQDLLVGSLPMRAYVDGKVTLTVLRNSSSGSGNWQATIIGYLIPTT